MIVGGLPQDTPIPPDLKDLAKKLGIDISDTKDTTSKNKSKTTHKKGSTAKPTSTRTATTSSTTDVTTANLSRRTTATDTSYNVYNMNQVQNAATNAFTNALGRNPTQKELNNFLSSLNTFAAKNPNVTTAAQDVSRVKLNTKNVAAGTTGTTSGKTTGSTRSTAGTRSTKTTGTQTVDTTQTQNKTSVSSGGVDVNQFAASQVAGTTEAKAVSADQMFNGAMDYLAKMGG